jgi:flagellar biogenesis protein FliO
LKPIQEIDGMPGPTPYVSAILLVAVLGTQTVAAQGPATAKTRSAAPVAGTARTASGIPELRNVAAEPKRSRSLRLPIDLVPTPQGTVDVKVDSDPAASAALALPPRKSKEAATRSATSPGRAVTTTVTSLAVVLGLFLLLVWFQRRTSSGGHSVLPGEVVQTLGRVPLNARQEMHLVHVGNKLLLLAVTASAAEPLTEITDPAEIDRLTKICQQNQPGNLSASFREILSQLNRQPSSGGLQYSSSH